MHPSLLPLLAFTLAATGTTAGAAQTPAVADETSISLPMDLSTGRPRLLASINGGPPQIVEFDTGSPGMVIQRATANRLQAPVVGETTLASPYGNAPPAKAKVVRLASVALGGVAAAATDAVVVEDASFVGADAPPIIGPGQFPGHVITLDYPAARFILSRAAPADAAGWQPLGRDGLLEGSVEIGTITVPLHIDSGNPGALTLPSSLASRIAPGLALVTIGAIRTVDRELPIELGDLGRDARVAGTDVRLGKTLFADIPTANLGSDALAGFRIIIDNPRKRWRLAAAGSERPLLESRPPRRPAPQPS